MSDTADDLSRIMREFAEKQEAEQAERDRVVEARLERLRAAGMSDEQIQVAGALIQEMLKEQADIWQKEWDRRMSNLTEKLKMRGVTLHAS
ncbi:hypothetical protein [Rhodococcus sp. Leaf233]|uniref:hypothetical protein n=1 Tax=Rhodococcus sp. Leaf233 TaxID=1736302 RepID=UPI000710759E|nr:hypothetical protein [Rhodococcus sp. Leaf233]KQU33553.1 hypothetical protein ASH04_06880 [Rhodococcus sp. Leaf233]